VRAHDGVTRCIERDVGYREGGVDAGACLALAAESIHLGQVVAEQLASHGAVQRRVVEGLPGRHPGGVSAVHAGQDVGAHRVGEHVWSSGGPIRSRSRSRSRTRSVSLSYLQQLIALQHKDPLERFRRTAQGVVRSQAESGERDLARLNGQ